jgi:hypothetical protein
LVGWNTSYIWLVKIELELGLILGTIIKKPDLGPENFEEKMLLGGKKVWNWT